MHLSKIKNNEKVSYETMRKTLILLTFYNFFEEEIQANIGDDFFAFTKKISETLLKTLKIHCSFADIRLFM